MLGYFRACRRALQEKQSAMAGRSPAELILSAEECGCARVFDGEPAQDPNLLGDARFAPDAVLSFRNQCLEFASLVGSQS